MHVDVFKPQSYFCCVYNRLIEPQLKNIIYSSANCQHGLGHQHHTVETPQKKAQLRKLVNLITLFNMNTYIGGTLLISFTRFLGMYFSLIAMCIVTFGHYDEEMFIFTRNFPRFEWTLNSSSVLSVCVLGNQVSIYCYQPIIVRVEMKL